MLSPLRRASLALLIAVLAATTQSARAQTASWLDQKPMTNWNMPGNPLPSAKPDPSLAEGFDRCKQFVRQETFPEDRAVRFAGWRLFGPYRLFNGTSIVGGLRGFDGMCRPIGYQEFVFAGGTFAGTLSPAPMDSRTDGSLDASFLYSREAITATFKRYKPSDPLCCASGSTAVSYTIDHNSPLGPVLRIVN